MRTSLPQQCHLAPAGSSLASPLSPTVPALWRLLSPSLCRPPTHPFGIILFGVGVWGGEKVHEYFNFVSILAKHSR